MKKKKRKESEPKQVPFSIYPPKRHSLSEIQVVPFKENDSIQLKQFVPSPIQFKQGKLQSITIFCKIKDS